MPDDEVLEPGLYETPLSLEIDSMIRADRELQVDIKPIPEDRRARALARLVSAKLAQRLGTLKAIEQVRLVNQVLHTLEDSDALVSGPTGNEPQELLSISRGEQRYNERPPIPLTDSALITNGRAEPALARVLEQELKTADRVDLLCAFVKWSGLRLLDQAFRDLQARGVPFRILTTTYMGATERGALERLAREYGAEIKINYDTAGTRLHAKSWLIYRNSGFSTAFVGSSNLSRTAMLDGLEWNVRVSATSAPALFRKLAQTFDAYWEGAAFETYDPTRDSVRLQRSLSRAGSNDGSSVAIDGSFLDVEPQPHQRIMLADLAHERAAGRHRNLVVAATGTGKTVLAALDYRWLAAGKPDALSLLFVAHRREILIQAQSTFRQVLHDGTFGELFVNGERPARWKHVFASVQSLSAETLNSLAPNQFDVVIIDEFHHAEAPSYQRVIDALRPRELLGLTATPERADGIDVSQEFFDGRIASELRLWDALEGDLLVPFHYLAIADNTDLRGVTFARGAYDSQELERLYVDEDRRSGIIISALAQRLLDPSTMKALAFCVSVRHAEHMAEVLSRAGIPARAMSGATSVDQRRSALADLRAGRIACICTVDLFNEGLDIPSIDTVLMLRPTQSATIFVQQLGRGLRRSYGKSVLTVLDFVGMQQRGFSFGKKYRALTGLGHKRLAEALASGSPALPPGCDLVFDEVAQQVVLENLRSELRLTTPALAREIRSYALDSRDPQEYSLTRFLVESDREMSQVLGRDKIHGHAVDWTRLLQLAGLSEHIDESAEAEYLRSRVRAFTHVDDPERHRLYTLLSAPGGPRYDQLDEYEQVAADMLFYNEWPDRGQHACVQDGLTAFCRHPWFGEKPGGKLAATPLKVHATHHTDELLAAIGIGYNFDRPRTPAKIREGVACSSDRGVDAPIIQLKKTDSQFSENTMYQDPLISEIRFHQHSQKTTSPTSPVGLRYSGQWPVAGAHRHRTVRARQQRRRLRQRCAYTFLGLADFVQATGSGSMSITWSFQHPVPPKPHPKVTAIATWKTVPNKCYVGNHSSLSKQCESNCSRSLMQALYSTTNTYTQKRITMDFDATQRSIAEVIRAGDHIIPRYQRDYAWEEENILDLWNDLQTAGSEGHFLGNMVVHSSGKQQWDLVDGQQRLTTILIAISVIKSVYEELEEHGRAEGLSQYIEQTTLSGAQSFRLQYRTGQAFLHYMIFSDPESRIAHRTPQNAAENAQKAAFDIFSNLVRSEVTASALKPVEAVDKIRDRFLQATVIYVRVGDKANAFRVFETLNDRGQNLRQIDLVKNQIISAIPPTASHEEEATWADTIRLIESVEWNKVGAEDFLGYYWNSTSNQEDDEIVAVSRIRRSIDRHIASFSDKSIGARRFIESLNQTAQIFKEIDRCLQAPNGKHWKTTVPKDLWRKDVFEEIDRALYGCLVPGSKLPLNALFSLLRSYIFPRSSRISKRTLIGFLNAIECLQFRWSISKRPSTATIRRAYRRAAFAVDGATNESDYLHALETFKSDAEKIMPTDSQFKDGLKGLTYFNQRPAEVFRIRRVLERIEEFWGSSRLPRNEEMTLEHIEPQGGRSLASPQNFWIGKLGNLMLLPQSINSSLPARFETKSTEVSKWSNPQDVVLNQYIALAEWGNSAANARMDSLLDIALKVWPRKF